MAGADASVHEASVEAVLTTGHEKDGVARRQLTLSAVGTMAVAVVFLLLAMTFGETLVSSTMDEEFEEMTVTRVTGAEFARTFYLDKPEPLKGIDPGKLYLCGLMKYGTIYAPLKFLNNE